MNERMKLMDGINELMQIGSPEKTQTSTHWNLVGRSIITSPPKLSPSSILHPPPSHCASIRTKRKLARFKKYFVYIFTFQKVV